MATNVSRLVCYLRTHTKYRPLTDPQMENYKKMVEEYGVEACKVSRLYYCKDSFLYIYIVQTPGVGQLSNTKDALYAKEISWILQTTCSQFTPWGLVKGLYFLSALVFNLRKAEIWRLEYGNFKVHHSHGEPTHIELIPGPSKKRHGRQAPSSRQAMKTFKRPTAPLTQDFRTSLLYYLHEHQ